MEVACVRFFKSKAETFLPVSKIFMKEKLNQSVRLIPFSPKDNKDFVTTKWYFAKKSDAIDETVWSRIIIVYLGATKEEIEERRKSERIKYANPKCITSESSFDDKLSQDSVKENYVRKEIASRRADNVLKKAKNKFEVTPFVDLPLNVSRNSSTVTENIYPVVSIEKLVVQEKKSAIQSSPESPSLITSLPKKSCSTNSGSHHSSRSLQRKRRLDFSVSPASSQGSKHALITLQNKSSSHAPSRSTTPTVTPRRKIPLRVSRSTTPNITPPQKISSRASESLTPDLTPSRNASPEKQLSSPSTPARNAIPEHQPLSSSSTPTRNVPDNQLSLSRSNTPIRNSPPDQDLVPEHLSPQNAQAEVRIQPRINRVRYYKMTELVKECIEYYKKRNRPGYEEMHKRYSKENGNMIYLGEGFSIEVLQWDLLQTHKPQIFLTELSMILMGERDLANRALDLSRGVKNIPNRSPVKLIEKEILRLIISL